MDELQSSNGAIRLCVQCDGNIVAYFWNGTNWEAYWASNTVLDPQPSPPIPPLPPIPGGEQKANFCNLYDSTNRPIFSSCLVAQSREMQEEWIRREINAGGNSYVLSVESGYENTELPPEWGYNTPVNYFTTGQFGRVLDSIELIQKAGLKPYLFLHSGGPHPGLNYFERLIDSLGGLTQEIKIVPAWEPVPGNWSTLQLRDTIEYLRRRVARDRLCLHLGRRRLSWSSNPLESDDPFKVWNSEKQEWETDEIASCRWAAPYIGEFLYQSDPFRPGDSFDVTVSDSNAERAKEVADRVLGNPGVPDWYAGLPRPILTAFETVAYYFIRGSGSETYSREVASFFQSLGYQGFGNGLPL